MLRRSFRVGKHVKHETLGDLFHLPTPLIDLIRRSLAGEAFVPAAETFLVERSLPHGHVEAVLGTLRKLGLERLIASQRSRQRDLVTALVVERLLAPCSKVATARLWSHSTLAAELGVEDADENELYGALDWLLTRQARIETKLAQQHLEDGATVLYDVPSSYYEGSYYEGRHCELAAFGHSHDAKKGKPIIVYGVLCDGTGRPVAAEVYPGATADPTTVPDQVEKLRRRFGLSRVVLVGDRGMLTKTQIERLRKRPGLGSAILILGFCEPAKGASGGVGPPAPCPESPKRVDFNPHCLSAWRGIRPSRSCSTVFGSPIAHSSVDGFPK